ncbi:polyprenol phosphomannose-dependent alpha 1,6 mannosyltransferase MptB [Actinoplanes sp. KI2]|uniref:polyprenol phosphomannose-dependent alpha 1,6 mannosyltransferase MptB n=1 Tax=Actinoplanes sp. KI2 TaxID=2983315 RepID=UPI0021D58502|nr:polyprenol phosphomannose-dependent alpha 1,6 mannosyltransferase MptB [Actinoplanes sp. KI2]MCU7725765.1 polyprenol phosphomannose-dependent alpha 1,6 mannosyltransferase MptB [Actinoplanes sp. KI2]
MSRPALVRYAGLAGSLLLAVAAWLGGASRPWQPTITPLTVFRGENGVVLPLAWLFGTALLIGAWWAGRKYVPSTRWAYVTAGLWVAPLLPFLPLASYDMYSYACQGWQQAAGLDPYAGGVNVLGCPWADAVAPTWRTAPAPYGPVFLLLAALAAKLGHSLGGTIAVLRVIALLGVGLIAVCLPGLARRAGVPAERAVWLVLACPLVPIHLVSGAHNDAVMVGLLMAGLALAVTRRSLPMVTAAGALLGLAVGVKATAVVVVPFVVLIVAVSPRRRANVLALLGGLVGALLAVSLAAGRGLGWITGLSGSGVSVQWTSPSTAVGMVLGFFGVNAVPVTRVIGMVLLAGVLIWLWWRARFADPLRYAALGLAATVVLAPVFHPWYAVWALAPLAVTVRRETRWLVLPCAVAAALCMPDGYNLALATKVPGAIAMTALLVYFGVKARKALHEAKSVHPVAAGESRAGDRLLRRDP